MGEAALGQYSDTTPSVPEGVIDRMRSLPGIIRVDQITSEEPVYPEEQPAAGTAQPGETAADVLNINNGSEELPTLRALDDTPGYGESVLPPVELDPHHVRDLLTDKGLSEEERIEQLLVYAYKTGTVIERPVPVELLPYMTDNPADWHERNSVYIDRILSERTPIEDIYDRTERYAAIPFLRNASTISESAFNRKLGDLGRRIQLAARMMVLEAMQGAGMMK